jgi:predicted DsbA family dithiol-disulfide isomerase
MEGISFAFDKIKRSPNTLDSHRLIKWAGSAGVQNKVVDQLFERYFENGENIGEHSVLLEAAKDAGMDVDIVRDLLASDSDLKQTELEDHQAREMGISGVPCFLFEGKFAIVGAQEVSSLTRYIDKVEAKILQQAAD